MDLIKEVITKALPEASTGVVSSVLAEIENHGVNSIDHLQYFNPETDTTVLKTIQKRILKKAIDDYFAKNKSQQIEVVASTSNLVPTTLTTPQHASSSSSSFSVVDNFSIPFHKFPKLIEQGKVPSPSQRLAIVRLICDDLQEVIEKPLKKHLEVVARKVIEKYPQSFEDALNKQKLGSGYASLLCQLINRCENTRRPKSTSTKRKLEAEEKIKISNADVYGCVRANYLPDFASDEDVSLQEDRKKELIEEYSHMEWNQAKVDLLMSETYAAQRFIIVKNVEIDVVFKEFPFLSVSVYFLKHVQKLLGFDVLQRLTHSIEDKALEVIKCIKNSQSIGIDKLQFIEVLCEYFEEDKKQFLMTFEEDRSIAEVVAEICPTLTPVIVALGNPYDSGSKCVLIWGNSQFADFINFSTAVAMWYSSFYVFNLKYPENLEATMEFIQRAFVDINPEKGSKAKKTPKPCNINNKVRKLTTKLMAFRWRIL